MAGRDSVFELVRSANVDLLREVLSHDPQVASQRDEGGVSALMHARYRGNEEILAALLAADPPLDVFEAAALGPVDRVAAALAADPNVIHTWAPDGFAPLHLAAYFGHPATVEFLLSRGADVAAVAHNPMQLTALHSAAAGRHHAIAAILLDHGAEVDAIQAGGFTPLHSAAQNGDLALVDLLLSHGADPQLEADDGRDATAIATERGHTELVDKLRRLAR